MMMMNDDDDDNDDDVDVSSLRDSCSGPAIQKEKDTVDYNNC